MSDSEQPPSPEPRPLLPGELHYPGRDRPPTILSSTVTKGGLVIHEMDPADDHAMIIMRAGTKTDE